MIPRLKRDLGVDEEKLLGDKRKCGDVKKGDEIPRLRWWLMEFRSKGWSTLHTNRNVCIFV